MTAEQFSLRWNNFHSNMTSGFHELLEAAEMVDVTLAVDGHFLQAHKIVLSICSPLFKQMFKANPCKHPIVILKDIGHENMKDILEFMYMGEVSVLRDNLTHFLRIAELLQVKGLTGDDSSEDASSNKDMKIEGDDENDMYNQLIEADVEIPSYSHSPASSTVSNIKRTKNTTNGSTNNKRSKVENYPPQSASNEYEPVQSAHESITINNSSQSSNVDNSNILNSLKTDSETLDIKEPINVKAMWDTSGAYPTDTLNSSDQDMLQCQIDQKSHVICPYCCRKFVNRYNLKVHVRDKHEANFKDLDCKICGKTMRNQSCLRVHMYHHRKAFIEEHQNIDAATSFV